jgi:hypothetical protein
LGNTKGKEFTMRHTLLPKAVLIAAVTLSSSAGFGQARNPANEPPTPSGASTKAPPLQVQEDKVSDSFRDLMDAVNQLRQASVTMIHEHEQNTGALKAFKAAQEAIRKVDSAMDQLPSQYRPGNVRTAKEWPAAAAHFDGATDDLNRAIADLQKQPSGPGRDKAIETLHQAIGSVHQAMVALPAWR